MASSLMDAALAYAERGWKVFPLQPDAKEPYPGSRGFQDASSDPDQIREWWTAAPDSNIGLATGRGSGLYVIDIDEGVTSSGRPKTGEQTWEALEAQYGETPVTDAAATPNGGRHLLFQFPEDVDTLPSTVGRLGPDVDTRGDGGYIILSPSTVDGRQYQWLMDVGPGPLPTWVISRVMRLTPEAWAGEVTWTRSDDEMSKYVRSVVEREVESLSQAPEGTRNDHLNRSAFALATMGAHGAITEEHARAALADAAEANGHLGYADGMKTFLKTFASGWRAGLEKPREPWPPKPQSGGTLLDRGESVQHPPPDQWFGPDGLQAYDAAAYVFKMGPLAMDRGEEWWGYEHGVWRHRKNEVQNRVVAMLRNRFRNSHLTNIQAVIRSKVPTIPFEPIPEFINCLSGHLDWRTGELRPHSPDALSTVQLPWEWDPEATCPVFDKYLSDTLAPDIIPMVWEMIGYMMYSGNPLQVAFLLHGKGQNGKGTLIRVLKALLGEENITAASLTALSSGRFAVAELAGKIANLAGDIDATYQESTAQFKAITGEDVMYAERKFGHPFTFTSYAVPVFSANKIPGSADTSEGYRRRWVIIPFSRHFSDKEKDIHLTAKLLGEIQGIAAHGVMSLRTLMEREGFQYGETALRAQDDFARAIDVVREWAEDACDKDVDAWATRSSLYASFKAWCQVNGLQKPMKAGTFYERLEQAGYRPASRGNQGRGYYGLYVREQRMMGQDGFVGMSRMPGSES